MRGTNERGKDEREGDMVYVLFLAAIQTKGDTSVYTTTVKSKQQKYGSLVY